MVESKDRDQYELPSQQVQQDAEKLFILNEHGEKTLYKALCEGNARGASRHLIVFVRHFYCGQCEQYVRKLTETIPPSTLAAVDTDLTVIGCGQPQTIAEYVKRTACPYPIYCDPDRALYFKLGMTSSLSAGDKKPEYSGSASAIGLTLSSMYNILSNGKKGFQGGDYAQNGGEWLYKDGEVTWCKRMRHTRDHAEVKELKKVLGMSE